MDPVGLVAVVLVLVVGIAVGVWSPWVLSPRPSSARFRVVRLPSSARFRAVRLPAAAHFPVAPPAIRLQPSWRRLTVKGIR